MKHLIVLLIFVVAMFASDKPPDPDVIRAVKDAKILRSVMRNPESFVLERVYIPVGDKTGNLCLEYRSQNGYGGMSRGVALFGKGHPVSFPAMEGVPDVSLATDDPYLPDRSHAVCEDVPPLRDLTEDTLAALDAENAEHKTDTPPAPKSNKH